MWKAAKETFAFYWLCARTAASGTLDWANAWFWLVGLPVIALAAGFWLEKPFHIPDTPGHFLLFMLAAVGVSWILMFAVRFARAPALLYATALAHKAAAEEKLKAVGDRIANSLVINASVENDFANDNRLEWHVVVENCSQDAVQYGDVSIVAKLDDQAEITRIGRGRIMAAANSGTYKFPFAGKYEAKEGLLVIKTRVQYGPPGQPPTREMVQKLRIPFQPRGAVTFSDCHRETYEDKAL